VLLEELREIARVEAMGDIRRQVHAPPEIRQNTRLLTDDTQALKDGLSAKMAWKIRACCSPHASATGLPRIHRTIQSSAAFVPHIKGGMLRPCCTRHFGTQSGFVQPEG
jgi:hypothetical protein